MKLHVKLQIIIQMTVNVLHNVLFSVFLQREIKKRIMKTQELQTTKYNEPLKAGPGLALFMETLREKKEAVLAELDSQMDYYFGNFGK